jgi:hypothetical protein
LKPSAPSAPERNQPLARLRSSRRWRSLAAAALLAAVLAFLTVAVVGYASQLSRGGVQGPLTDPFDFTAFYCAGKVLAQGHDPYRSEPLRTCERRALAASHIAIVPYLVAPAPLPPYALVAFGTLARVPFVTACAAFFVLSLAASAAAILLCLRLARISAAFVAAAVCAALVMGSLYIGQIVPLVLVALCGCALALRAGRFGAASLCALATMAEPHVGFAAVLALFVLERRTRVALAAGGLALVAVSLLAGGFALNVEYLTQVLPAHARSEVGNFGRQLSLTATAYALGAGVRTALILGEASYVAMLALGIEFGRRLAVKFDDRAFFALTPVAAVLFGGVFLHDHQIALALPFGFLLARYTPRRAFAYAALAVLAVPWPSALEVALLPLFPPHLIHSTRALAAVANGSLLAEAPWQAWITFLNARDSRTPLEMFGYKLPTWFALYALGLIGLSALRARPSAKGHPPGSALRAEIRR